MKIVVIGAGKVGKALCAELANQSHDISLIESDENVASTAGNFIDVKTFFGRGEIADVQREAGVERADLVVAVTEEDQTNIMCTLIAKSLGAKAVVARVRDYDMFKQAEYMRESLGIDMLVNPEFETAEAISRMLRYPTAVQVDYSEKARVDIVSMEIYEGNELVGEKLADIGKFTKSKVLICGIKRDGKVTIPNGEFVFNEGDVVFLTGKYLAVEAFFKRCGHPTKHAKSVLVVGGSRIAGYLAQSLHASGIDITIIDPDMKICTELSEEMSFVSVVHGDGTDKQLLIEHGVDKMGAVVALTGHDEVNIMVSLYAKNLGTSMAITKINNGAFNEVAESLELGRVIAPKVVASAKILQFVKMLMIHEKSMLGYYPIFDGSAPAVVFQVDNESVHGMRIRDIKLRTGVLIAGVVKRGVPSLPNGDTELCLGDTVLIISADTELKKFDDILSKGD